MSKHSSQSSSAVWVLYAVAAGAMAQAQTTYSETVLHNFAPFLAPKGAGPSSGVITDPAGNFLGTTAGGGAWGQGVVYKVDPAGHQTVLHSFTGGAAAGFPYGGLIRDEAGSLFGTYARRRQCLSGILPAGALRGRVQDRYGRP